MHAEPWTLVCDRCASVFALAPLVSGCPACAERGETAVLEMRFAPPTPPDQGQGHEHYRALMPFADGFESLGEGGTPLLRSRQIGPALGLEHVYFKLESCNPTWSFKDRYCAVSVNAARSFGFERIVVSSTGNLGVAAAAYATALGLECALVALADIADPMLGQARAHGAHVITTSRRERQRVFEQIASRPGWFPLGLLLPRPIQNPFGVEGYRALAWEMIDALGQAPDAVLLPCARGNGLYGAWKGFVEAQRWGWAQTRPRMFACQPQGANSIEVSLSRGVSRAVELDAIDSIAASAAETVSDDRAIAAVRDSAGGALSIDDGALLRGCAALAREGICVEPSSALPVACLPGLIARGAIARDDRIVCVLTAGGTRWPAHLACQRDDLVHVDGPDDDLDSALGRLA